MIELYFPVRRGKSQASSAHGAKELNVDLRFVEVRRVYHFHVRKTAGSSLCAAFEALPDHAFFDSAHVSAETVKLEPETFTVTILRDPVSRAISYYRYLVWVRENYEEALEQEPWADTVLRESAFLDGGFAYFADQLRRMRPEGALRTLGVKQFVTRLFRLRRVGGFDDFLARVSPRKLLAQLYMFSTRMDPEEAAKRILACDEVCFTETFPQDLARLSRRLEINLEEKHSRRFGEPVTLTDAQREKLRRLLGPEYQMLELVRGRCVSPFPTPTKSDDNAVPFSRMRVARRRRSKHRSKSRGQDVWRTDERNGSQSG